MLRAVFGFELAYWLRRPLTWLFFATIFLLAFWSVASEAALKFGAAGAIHRNAPLVIATAMGGLTAVGQAITTAIAGTAVLRDAQVGAQELLFTTRVRKADYLGGRFLGSLAAMLVIYAGLPLGLLVGSLMPWVPADALGPVRPWHVVQPFLVVALPNLLFVSALLFAVGALTRKPLAVYVTGTVLLVAWQITRELTGDLDALGPAALSDPFALTTIGVATRYWSVAEKNARVVPFAGLLLENRLIWLAVAGALFALVSATFRLRLAAGPRPAARPRSPDAPPAARPEVEPAVRHDGAARLAMFAAALRLHLRSIVREAPFLAISFICVTNLVMASWFRMHRVDSVTWPVTATLAPLVGETSHLILVVIATLYGGELVFRERQLRAAPIHDALPAPSWVTFGAKAAALSLAMAALLVVMALGAMASQLAQGHFDLQPWLYAQVLGLVALPTAVSLALLALGVHALVDRKFVGHLALVAYYVLVQVASSFGFDHRLYQIGVEPGYTYSDLNGWGPYLPRLVTQQAYGLSVAGLVAVAGCLFLARGAAGRRGERARRAGARLRQGGWAAAAALALSATAWGGYFYYNADVLNAFTEVRAAERRVAGLEREYKRYDGLPQPRVTGVELRHDFFPERRAAAWRGALTAVNRHGAPIDTLYVRLPDALPRPLDRYEAASNTGVALDALDFDREAALERDDTAQGVRIYRLARPLAPGESLRVNFAGRFEPRGFPNDAFNNDVAENGSFMSSNYLPGFGYDPAAELAGDDARKRNGLAPKPPMRPADDPAGRLENALRRGADWVTFAATVCTAPDQTALAPGYLEREWLEGGRRCYRYATDRPVLGSYAVLSGRYAVRRETHQGVELAIYHHPGHEFALASMLQAARDGLDYFGASFGPYQFRQFRVVEFPRYRLFAQPLPTTIPFSEGIGFLYRHDEGDDAIDYAYFVTAHELAHQWWGHQIVGADVRGATLLSESLAEYSALALIERRFGPEAAQKFLRRELDGYLEGRGDEARAEVPLLAVEDQRYIHYPKGSLAFYALRDYIGEARLNGALAAFVASWAFRGPPYPTAPDLYAELERATPPEHRGVLRDLFLEMTFFENRAVAAEATKRPDGRYEVRLTLAPRKLRADGGGAMTEAPLDDLIDVGVFGERVPGQKLGKALWVQKVKASGPELEVRAVVDEAPRRAGIDPYNKLIDRTPEDNLTDVEARD
ncbi:MAG TPA: M1 family aminopeptidase [Polyangiaceae bacterium]|nr:M1 family aminopeptidase [Polyangiaceae bacterium]